MSESILKQTACLPIIAPYFEDVIERIEENESKYRYFELWLDYLAPLSIPRLKQLGEKYSDRLLVLFRRTKLEQTQTAIGDVAQTASVLYKYGTWFDFDVRTQAELLAEVLKRVPLNKVVLSYHNYIETPKYEDLLARTEVLFAESKRFQESVIKVSCLCKSDADVLNLVRLLAHVRKRTPSYCITGMGEYAKALRIGGPYFGNYFSFAASDPSQVSAPGQYTLEQLTSLLSTLSDDA